MKRSALLFAILVCCSTSASSDTPKRPHILGIAYVKILVSEKDKAVDFYSLALKAAPPYKGTGAESCTWCERRPMHIRKEKKHVGPVELGVTDDLKTTNRLAEIAFRTSDLKKLRDFLSSKGLSPGEVFKCADDPCFELLDPENHRIVFVASPVKTPIIHAGFVVHDRAAEDKFYKDILGFHVYWHGGMKEGEDNWVDMQVPDGTDWLEYMLNVPADASKHTLGVMNHIALGVPDIHAAEKQLRANGWTGSEEPKIGRDGKWQLNLYDPDDTRVEFMEFIPTQKPCCSEFTGPHPGPQSQSKAPAKP